MKYLSAILRNSIYENIYLLRDDLVQKGKSERENLHEIKIKFHSLPLFRKIEYFFI